MFLDVLSRKDRVLITFLCGLWFGFVVAFWAWWLQSVHVSSSWGFGLTSLVIAWTMLLPGYCFYYIQRMRQPSKQIVANNIRVAMVVTKAPSEPLEIVTKTLIGALAQKFPHDTWVADEDPTPEALNWYEGHGVKVSTRKNIVEYHNTTWPRRTKCKEGNLAYFYDKYGYKKYDIVVQLDADHVPQKGYLEEMISPFSDSKVGYVAAPSICDSNKDTSWSARARMQSEAAFHGPIQCGTNDGWVPVCIGSHYAVRTTALKNIGGIGPELAEDYSTTMLFNAHGWKGVWSLNAQAKGEGPNSFEDVIVQDYQWSRSMMTLFLTLYPKVFMKLNFRQKLQFTFAQLWYPMGALVWLISTLLPIAALLSGKSPVNVEFIDFTIYVLPSYLVSMLILNIIRVKGFLRPRDVKFFSWENALFELARWPWVLVACVDAIIAVVTKKTRSFRVTSKNKASSTGLSMKILLPYLLVSSVSVMAIILRRDNGNLNGYYWFAQMTAWIYIGLSLGVIMLHLIENKPQFKLGYLVNHKAQLAWSMSLVVILLFAVVSKPDTEAVAHDQTILETTVQPIKVEDPKIVLLPRNYIVHAGDSLWKIAERYYGEGKQWPKIKTNNNSSIVHPGDVVEIPY